MRQNYPVCNAATLHWEIGPGRLHANTDYKGDKRTRDGVTQPTYDAFRARKDLPPKDVFLMTDAERDEIYKSQYWDRIGADNLASGVDMIANDCAVNGSHILTWLASTERLPPSGRIQAIHAARIGYWRCCPNWILFHTGWLARERDILAKSLALAGAK